MQDALRDHNMTSVTSAEQRKKNKSAQLEEPCVRQESQSKDWLSGFCTNYFRFAEQLLKCGVTWVF
jgi:hypothetical protein